MSQHVLFGHDIHHRDYDQLALDVSTLRQMLRQYPASDVRQWRYDIKQTHRIEDTTQFSDADGQLNSRYAKRDTLVGQIVNASIFNDGADAIMHTWPEIPRELRYDVLFRFDEKGFGTSQLAVPAIALQEYLLTQDAVTLDNVSGYYQQRMQACKDIQGTPLQRIQQVTAAQYQTIVEQIAQQLHERSVISRLPDFMQPAQPFPFNEDGLKQKIAGMPRDQYTTILGYYTGKVAALSQDGRDNGALNHLQSGLEKYQKVLSCLQAMGSSVEQGQTILNSVIVRQR